MELGSAIGRSRNPLVRDMAVHVRHTQEVELVVGDIAKVARANYGFERAGAGG
jgi:hypothetical protein